MANLWQDAVPTATLTNAATASLCPEYFVPAGSVVYYDDSQSSIVTVQLSTAGLYYPNCESNGDSAKDYDTLVESSYLGYHDPFYGSVVSMAYSLASATVMAWLLVILLLIAQKKRPLFQIFTTVFVAVSLTVFFTQATNILEDQYYEGYHDAEELRRQVFGGMAYRVLDVLMTLIVWLAHIQVLLTLFERPKEKRVIKFIGAFFAIGVVVLWSFVNFFVPYHSLWYESSSVSRLVVPPLAYAFQIAITLIYAVGVILYSIRKRKYAFGSVSLRDLWRFGRQEYTEKSEFRGGNSRKTGGSVLAVGIVTILCLFLPLIFFILDICKYWFAGWSEFIRWVCDVAASVIVYEWVDAIEREEREEQKTGVLGKQIFEEDDPGFLTRKDSKESDVKTGKVRSGIRAGIERLRPLINDPTNNPNEIDSGSDSDDNGVQDGPLQRTRLGFLKTARNKLRFKRNTGATDGGNNNEYEMMPIEQVISNASSGGNQTALTHEPIIEISMPPETQIENAVSSGNPADQTAVETLTEAHGTSTTSPKLQQPVPEHYVSGGSVNATSGSKNKYWPFGMFFRHNRGWSISRASSTASSTESSTSYGTQLYVSGNPGSGSLAQYMNSTNGIVVRPPSSRLSAASPAAITRRRGNMPPDHRSHFLNATEAPQLYNIDSEQDLGSVDESYPPTDHRSSHFLQEHTEVGTSLRSQSSPEHSTNGYSNTPSSTPFILSQPPFSRNLLHYAASPRSAGSPLEERSTGSGLSSRAISRSGSSPGSIKSVHLAARNSSTPRENISLRSTPDNASTPGNDTQEGDIKSSGDLLAQTKMTKYVHPLRKNSIAQQQSPNSSSRSPVQSSHSPLQQSSQPSPIRAPPQHSPSVDQFNSLSSNPNHLSLPNIQEGPETTGRLESDNLSPAFQSGSQFRLQQTSPTGQPINYSNNKGKRRYTSAQLQQSPPRNGDDTRGSQLHEHYVQNKLPSSQPQYMHSLTTNSRAARSAALKQEPQGSKQSSTPLQGINTSVSNGMSVNSTEADNENENDNDDDDDDDETYEVIQNTSGAMIPDSQNGIDGHPPDEELPQFSSIPGFSPGDYWDEKAEPNPNQTIRHAEGSDD